jgi:large subunit ribosomal protein L28
MELPKLPASVRIEKAPSVFWRQQEADRAKLLARNLEALCAGCCKLHLSADRTGIHGGTCRERPNSFQRGAISGSMKIRSISKFSVGSNVTMALVCEICGKKPSFGNTISHAHNVRRRRWNPNLRRVKAVISGVRKHVRVCTACIRAGRVKKAA